MKFPGNFLEISRTYLHQNVLEIIWRFCFVFCFVFVGFGGPGGGFGAPGGGFFSTGSSSALRYFYLY